MKITVGTGTPKAATPAPKQPAKPAPKNTLKDRAIAAAEGKKAVLPTSPSSPVGDISDLIWLLYGEKKIGKTGLASQFPDAFFFAFEKGYKGLSIFAEDMTFERGPKKGLPSWDKFKAFLDTFVEGEHQFKTGVVDTVDIAYEACQAWYCRENNISHPQDQPYGKGWHGVNTEFTTQMGRLVNSGYGVIFLSHATEREFVERTGGTYDKIVPTVAGQGKKYIAGVADAMVFYGYHGNERLLTIRGSDALESGHRLPNNFFVKGGQQEYLKLKAEIKKLRESGTEITQKLEAEFIEKLRLTRVHSIPAGIDSEEAYLNFLRAFRNEQPFTGEPERKNVAVLTDVRAPMKR